MRTPLCASGSLWQQAIRLMNLAYGALSVILLASTMPAVGQAGRPVLTPKQPPAPADQGNPPVSATAPAAAPAGAPTAPTGADAPDGTPADAGAGSTAIPPKPTTPPAQPVMVAPDYRIGPDDSLQVTVAEDSHMSGAVLVRPDGKISLPMIGDVPAAGFTPVQLALNITELVKKYVKDPTVTVAVLSINSKQVIMVGEVMRVGPLPMRPNMTVLQAIVTAGGLSPYANKKKIYILRGEPGHEQRIPFNYKKSLLNDDTLVQPGDRIVVPD